MKEEKKINMYCVMFVRMLATKRDDGGAAFVLQKQIMVVTLRFHIMKQGRHFI